jgi:hypothetical protein
VLQGSLLPESLDFERVSAYLTSLGWNEEPERRAGGKLALFVAAEATPDTEGVELAIPVVLEARDAQAMAWATFSTLADILGKTLEEITSDAMAVDRDIVETTFVEADRGGIPLKYAELHLKNLSKLFLSCIKSEVILFPKPSAVAKSLSRQLMFEHTARGSFRFRTAFNVRSQRGSTTIERRVTTKVAHVLSKTDEALKVHSELPLLSDDVSLTTDICASMASLVYDAGGRLDANMRWATIGDPPEGFPSVVTAAFEPRAKYYLEAARDHLKKAESEKETEDNAVLRGRVVTLHSDEIPFLPDAEREITVLWLSKENETPLRVRMRVTAEDYELAQEAHKQGCDVTARGRLIRDRTRTYLLNAELDAQTGLESVVGA